MYLSIREYLYLIVLDKSLSKDYYWAMVTNSQAVQVKVTLPNELYFFLKSKADRFGLTMSSYMKHLALRDVQDMDLPTFKMSPKNEEIALKALEELRNGKAHEIIDIDDYLNSLNKGK